MSDIDNKISELDIVDRNNKTIKIQPLTYLALHLAKQQKEQQSNAAGFINAGGTCVKLTKKQIKAGFKSDCDTESKGDAATVSAVEEYLKKNPEAAAQNENLKNDVEKAGGWKNFWANFSTWSKTEQGNDILNTAGGLLAGLMGNQKTPDYDITKELPTDTKTGLSPVWWVLIAVGGIALIGGITFAIIKFGVKKQ